MCFNIALSKLRHYKGRSTLLKHSRTLLLVRAAMTDMIIYNLLFMADCGTRECMVCLSNFLLTLSTNVLAEYCLL